MKTILIIATAGLLSVANAQDRSMGDPPMKDQGGMREGRGLHMIPDLDEATSAKIDKLRDEHRKEVIALRAKMETARVDFRSMMKKETPDESALLARQKEISGIRGEIEAAKLKHRLAVGKLLTPEQRKVLAERRGRRFEGRHAFGKRSGDGRRGPGRHERGPRGFGRDGSCCR